MRSARKRSRLRRCASNRGDDPFGDDPLDVFVAGLGAFLDIDGKFFGPAKNFVFRIEKDGLRLERSNELSKSEKFYVLDTYATLLFKTGQKEKAVLTLENAISLCNRADAKKEMQDRINFAFQINSGKGRTLFL